MIFNTNLFSKYGAIYSVWFDLIETENISEIAEETVDQVIENLFIAYNIEPVHFILNYKTLLIHAGVEIKIEEGKLLNPSPSLIEFTKSMKSPEYIPIWFIAAYPEVVIWYKDKQESYINLNGREKLVDFNTNIFNIVNPLNQKLADSNNNHSPELLKNLIENYLKEKIAVKIETAS